MAHPIFRWIDCTDRRRPRRLKRPEEVRLRLAQLTDPHVPGEIELMRRLRDLMAGHETISEITHQLSAISNEMGHPYRNRRRLYTNLIKKALFGLHQLEVDHLVITGDLTHCSLPTEFIEIRGALEVTGWLDDEKLTVIPGNHDRFNLYERYPKEPMEAYFDVVNPRRPRLKKLAGGVALFEIDTNREPDDRHPAEQWLPNTVGKIYEEVPAWFERHSDEIAGMHVVVLLHHHISSDWYVDPAGKLSGLMLPAEGVDELLEALESVDPEAILLHGHRHEVMPVEYDFRGHQVGCPGDFANHLRLNLIDFDAERRATLTQIALRA